MWAFVGIARADLRQRWRSWLALTLLVALAGGVVMAAVVGASRTDTAYARFLKASRASDVVVSPMDTGLPGYYSALTRLRGVAIVGRVAGVTAFPLDNHGRPEIVAPPLLYLAADEMYGREIDRPKLLEGRLPRPDRADEIVVDQIAARSYGLRTGSTLELLVPQNISAGPPRPGNGLLLHERVVGVDVTRTGIVGITPLDSAPNLLGTPALLTRVLSAIGGPSNLSFDGAYVRLRHGESTSAFDRVATKLAKRFPETGEQVFVANEADQAAAVERAIHPEAIALLLFALATSLTALVIVGQAASRQLFLVSDDHPPLRALGMSRIQLTVARLAEVAATALAGAGAAVGLAVVASPLTPVGPARLAEPQPGIDVNASVLGIGATAIVLLLVALMAWPAWRLADLGSPRARSVRAVSYRSRVGAMTSRAPLTIGLGIRMALDPGRGRTAVPVRSALGSTAVSVLAVTAALTFGANLTHLVTTPQLYGRSWDVMLDPQSGFSSISSAQIERLLRDQHPAPAWSGGDHGVIDVDGHMVPAIGIDPGHGTMLFPTLLQGRAPVTNDEIVLGTKTLRRTGHRLGDKISVTINGRRHTFRIVGRAVFPAFGQGSFTPTDLGEGAATRAAALGPNPSGPNGGYNFVLVRFANSPSDAAEVSRLGSTFTKTMGLAGCKSEACGFYTAQHPTDIGDFSRVEAAPAALAAVLGVLGIGVLSQLLIVATRRRRRDLAILRMLGLLRPQVSMAVAWQSMTVTMFAFALGVPAGLAVGRWLWQLFANTVGVSPSAIIPVLVPILMVPVMLLAASLVAGIALWGIGRLPLATLMRRE